MQVVPLQHGFVYRQRLRARNVPEAQFVRGRLPLTSRAGFPIRRLNTGPEENGRSANETPDLLMKQMTVGEGGAEQPKHTDRMLLVQLTDSAWETAAEIINKDPIYALQTHSGGRNGLPAAFLYLQPVRGIP